MELEHFIKDDFNTALKSFFNSLNINLNKTIKKPIDPQNVLKNNYDKNNKYHKSLEEIHFMGFVDDNCFKGTIETLSDDSNSNLNESIKTKYDSMVVLGVVLKENHFSKTALSDLTRLLNKSFQQSFSLYNFPVIIVFKYGDHLSFANCERVDYKKSGFLGEKLGKVSILKDINIKNTHSGHLRILEGLKIKKDAKAPVNTFELLYKYWQEVFSVSVLNKKFYQELSNWYFWAIKQVSFPNEPTLEDAHKQQSKIEDLIQEHKAKNVIRLLTRLLFVWFIKEKKLIPEALFDLKTLQNDFLNEVSPYHEEGLFKEANKDSIYYKAILQNLFFATLNCPIKPTEPNDTRVRGFRKLDNYGQQRGADFLMRYEKHFKNPQKFLEMVNEVVPFLNGGLFECLDDKQNNIYIDGFSDNSNIGKKLIVPDYLFFGIEEKVDLSAEYGIKNKGTQESAVKGLINILKSYKFTVDENTPLEEEIALDPELLGKVFENLLASYNPETKTTARKQTGSFYTPREIVNYMVDESLIAYLKEKILNVAPTYLEFGNKQTQLLDITEHKNKQLAFTENLHKSRWEDNEQALENELKKLFSYNHENTDFTDEETNMIIKELNNCKILDPACGSGAFPMGVLHKMVYVLKKLDPKNIKWEKEQREKTIGDKIKELEEDKQAIKGLKDEEVRQRAITAVDDKLRDIEEVFKNENNFDDYSRKLYLIENCIYGVDIQPIATQISKLRFFISLIVDQNPDNSKDNFGIRALPNLEAKFVAANTLVGIDKQMNIFETEKINKLEKELKENRHKIFSSKTPSIKKQLKERDKELREKMADLLKENGLDDNTAKRLATWDPYDQNTSSDFFDMEWMFGIKYPSENSGKSGFDIVIGNPPYGVSLKGIIREKIIKNLRKVPDFEIYYFFIEFSYKVLKINGIKSYIIPNTILFNVFAEKYRISILDNWSIIEILDCTNFDLFEGATVRNIITFFSKSTNNEFLFYKKTANCLSFSDLISRSRIKINKLYLKQSNQNWGLVFKLNSEVIELISKIKKSNIKLETSFPDVSQGLIAYDTYKGQSVDTIKNRVFHYFSLSKKNLKFWLWGEDVTKYNVKWNQKEYIDYCSDIANPRDPKFFNGERILIREITNPSIFASYTNQELYNDPSIIIILKSNFFNIKILLGILNSKFATFYHFNSSPKATKGAFPKILVYDINNFPLPKILDEDHNLFIDIVDQIMEKKKLGEDTQELENQIDQMVYKLYNLTADEIKIVDSQFLK